MTIAAIMKGTTETNPPQRYFYDANRSNLSHALKDLAEGLSRFRLLSGMALRNFRNQYKGAILGPFWLTITTAMTAAGLGVLYGQLFGLPLSEHLTYVTTAIIVWTMISAFITGGCEVFVGNSHIFKEFPLPLSLFAYRLVLSQILIVFFRLIVLAVLLVIFPISFTQSAWLALPGFLLLLLIGFWGALGLGVLNARYRDFGQLVAASLTFIFFVTPIFWLPGRLGPYSFVVDFNPFYHMIEVVRGPLLGHENVRMNFVVTGSIAAIVPFVSLWLFGRWSNRVPYWC